MSNNISTLLAERLRLRHATLGFRTHANSPDIAAFDPPELNAGRLERLQNELRRANCVGGVFYDPLNVRYATGTRNMSVWLLHNPARYCFVPVTGKPVLFEFPNLNCQRVAQRHDGIAEVRPAKAYFYTMAGEHRDVVAKNWAQEIASLAHSVDKGTIRIAIDRLDAPGFAALTHVGIEVVDGLEVAELARRVKLAIEIDLIDDCVAVAEAGIRRIQAIARPGVSENELFAELQHENTAAGGEWLESRLLTSGSRTNPWFQESSERCLEAGDLVAIDTDLIGPHGYCADISRSFVSGTDRALPSQRTLYSLAYEQITHNASLLGPGVSFRELAEKGWRIPARYRDQCYGMLLHGVGMADEGPVVALDALDPLAPQGILEPGMCVSVESYMGEVDGAEGVKLEHQYVITTTGARALGTELPPEELLAVGS